MFRLIAYSNLWISIGSALLCWQTFYLNKLEIDYKFILFVFFSTLVSYNAQRLFRINSLTRFDNKSWVVNHKKIALTLTGLGLIGALITLTQFLTIGVLVWLMPLGIISLLYSLKKLRDIPYLKIFLISISWGVLCGVIPFALAGNYNPQTLILNFIIITCYITAITIPFDIRDLDLDEETKKTIPQIMGVSKAIKTALIILGISLFLFAFQFNLSQSLIYLLSCLISSYLIYNSSKEKPDIYYTLLIDGHIILQFLLIFFLS